ncbi:hypothetical protein HMPREF9151_01134 [Hoylesella saccharolytica F0055]|uniref:Uncharacterized protein n=1 Tax=Hoylesella saccharolytica F0055 TaxID=1127699 RepID=L1NCL7_9BACT|nr:hypothetical protein HMPREF9151_01134 [Hoylesella saccharolytica F0055]
MILHDNLQMQQTLLDKILKERRKVLTFPKFLALFHYRSA